MERVTDRQIERKVKLMQSVGMDVGLDGQYGRFRVTNRSEDRDLSPRAPNRQILDWLFAYEEGYWAGQKAMGEGMIKQVTGCGQ